MADNIGVHWFRLDLRLSDNPSIENLSKNVASIPTRFACNAAHHLETLARLARRR